ncbi:hypothetical protein VTK26DRAFT_527 [Humicola hyalothermophila]
MWFKGVLFAAATLLPPALGFNLTTYCATPPLTPEQEVAHKAIAAKAAAMGQSARLRGAAIEPYEIKVYVHVVAAGESWDEGWIPVRQISQTKPVSAYKSIDDEKQRDKIANQIFVLNVDFYAANFKFTFADVDYIINPTWAADLDEFNMKQALRKGTY